MKPFDVEVPSWVNWIAQDKSGTWWGFEQEPNEGHNFWYENEVGRIFRLCEGELNPSWRETLTPR